MPLRCFGAKRGLVLASRRDADYSLSEPVKPCLRMATQRTITTATQPARPVKNITSSACIAQIITFNAIVRFDTLVSTQCMAADSIMSEHKATNPGTHSQIIPA